jgi:5-methylcytosine-specific restriction endonuclease McrBC regulatory subunit McrC
LATSANRLTPDIPLNQLVATAHRRLSALAYPDARLSARVRALDPVFRGITSLPGRLAAPGLVPARYREIERLARLILDERSTLPTDTGVTGVSVMFDMTRIWENYVGSWLRHRSPGITVNTQQPVPLTDTGPKRTGFADFVLHSGGKPIAVYDAKYRPWRSTPSTDEIYQLFTYAQRLGVSDAALVYPAAESHYTTTTVGPVTIKCWAIPIEP